MVTKQDRKNANDTFVILNVLIVIFLSIFIVNYIRALSSGEVLTFKSFIEALSNVYTFDIPNMTTHVITADWGLFNFLKTFFNSLASIIAFGVWFSISTANAVMIILQLLPLLLIG